ncbi:hypothetical protein MNBD_NITROSPINAE04-625 [hydrothermal vent metagenome]|uniref:HPt domain-containing protein n=1 Tax=hydrothermal vent metagenome TaxID=652676 RepID=A0A3B1CF65_9ZZZZ
MDDFIEELWADFADETGEHLIGIGLLLEKAGKGLNQEETATLYREIHSITNLARAMGLTGMEQVAGGCEIIVAKVRNGESRVDSSLIKLLGESRDLLSQMRQAAISSRKDSEAPTALTDRLEEALFCFSTDAATALSISADGASLRKDRKMLEFFGAIVKDNIPGLTSIVSNDYDGTEKQRAIVMEALNAIKKASEGMGYDRMTDLLERLAPQIPARGPLDDRLEKTVLMFVELKQMIDNLERETGAVAGGDSFSPAIKAFSLNKLGALFDGMLESLTAFKNRGSADDPRSGRSLAEKVSSMAKSAHGYIRFAHPCATGYAMIFLEDIYNRIARDEIAPDSEAVCISIELIALERRIVNERNQEIRGALETENRALIEKIKNRISAGERSRFKVEIDAQANALLSKVSIKPEMRELISAENMSSLLGALRDGWRIYEITTHLESDEQMAMAFMQWAKNRTRVITSRSLIIGKESWFEFLVACESAPGVVLNEIKRINPKGDLLQVREC